MNGEAMSGVAEDGKRFPNRGFWDGFRGGYNSLETVGGAFSYSPRTRHAV